MILPLYSTLRSCLVSMYSDFFFGFTARDLDLLFGFLDVDRGLDLERDLDRPRVFTILVIYVKIFFATQYFRP